jgi:plastocyanin
MDLRGVMTISVLISSLAAASGCGSSGTPATTPTPPASSSTITIVGQNGTQAFTPNPASFGGQQVVFKNNDTITHRVVLNDGSVDTGDIPPGGTSRTVAMPSAGTNYHCAIHPGMIGSTSAGAGVAPPMCEGPYCSAY